MMDKDNKDKGFRIIDRRFFFQDEAEKERIKREEMLREKGAKARDIKESAKTKAQERKEETSVDFSSFIYSLSTSALYHLGEIPDPVTRKREKNLPMAKQTIDIIAMLKEKTRGNLNRDEEEMIDGILYELRMKYVKASS